MKDGNGFNDNDNNEEFEDLSPQIRRFEDMIRGNANYFFDVDVFEAIIDHYLDTNNIKSALKGISIAISQHPNAVPILLRKAEIHASAGKLNKSLEILARAESLEPFNADVYILRGSIFSQLRDHEEAVRNLKLAIKHSDDQPDDLYVDLAFEYESLKKWDKAIGSLMKALELNKENEAALFELSYCYEMCGMPEKSIDFFNKFIDDNPYSFTAWYNLGNSYIRRGLFEKAIEAFDFCITINESFSSAYFNKANAYVQMERYHEAIDCYAETFLYEEPQAVTYCYIGECFEKLEMAEQAYENFLKASEIDPELADSWLGMGIALSMMGAHTEAVNFIEKAIHIDEKNPDFWFIFGEVLEKADMIEDALRAYLKAIELDPHNIDLLLDYTNFLYEHFSAETAIETMQQIILKIGKVPDLMYRMVAYLIFGGRKAEAITQMEEALQVNYDAHKKLFTYFPEIQNLSAITELTELYRKK
ncbi:MAG: tetratricopeptide repeat protein [Bacteroidota bacterium]